MAANSTMRPRGTTGLRERLDTTKIGTRSLSWYISGWRLGIFFFVLAVLFPFLVTGDLVEVGVVAGYFAIAALGLNIVVGYAGLLDLGYVAFFALGAYVNAVGTSGEIFNNQGKVVNIPMFNWWLLIPVGMIVASFFGVVLGAPTLRLRGDYLAIVTLGFGEIVPLVFNNVPYFNKSLGYPAAAPDDIIIGPIDVPLSTPIDKIWYYLLVLGILALVILFVSLLRNSSMGRAWIAIREDETAAAASGINLVRTKLLAFGLGALIGGAAGFLYAGDVTNLTGPLSIFGFQLSIFVLAMVVLGGIGSIPGVILGAVALKVIELYVFPNIDNFVKTSPLVAGGAPLHFLGGIDFNQFLYLFYGLVLIIMVRLRPQGLIPDARRKRELAGIGAAVEGTSSVGLLTLEEGGMGESGAQAESAVSFEGAGSDAQNREVQP